MAGKYDLDTTTLGTLIDDPEAKAILEEAMPGFSDNPMVGMAKGMPFNTIMTMAAGQIPADAITTVREKLGAL